MVSIKGGPLGWVPASIVYGLDALSAVGRWVGCVLGLASVQLHKAVTDLFPGRYGQNTVLDTVLTVERNGGVATGTSRESGTRQDSNASEVSRLAASQTEGHGAAVGETEGEAELLVDTEFVVNLLPDCVKEGNILSILVAPSPVETIGGHKDGALTGKSSEAVVGSSSTSDRVHVTVEPVQAKDEAVLALVVIVLRHAESVAALLVVDCDGMNTTVQSGGFATACCCSGHRVEK